MSTSLVVLQGVLLSFIVVNSFPWEAYRKMRQKLFDFLTQANY